MNRFATKTLVTASIVLASALLSAGNSHAAVGDTYSGNCQLGNAKFFILVREFSGGRIIGHAQAAFSDSSTNIRVRVNGVKHNVGRGSPNGSNSIAINAGKRGNTVKVRATGRGSAFGSCRMVLRAS